ncbi:MAG: hypothetical protein HYS12_01960 [Planctomycetes bacterium]|nr:hypothetical protein [Planctomycetota bacterium]
MLEGPRRGTCPWHYEETGKELSTPTRRAAVQRFSGPGWSRPEELAGLVDGSVLMADHF